MSLSDIDRPLNRRGNRDAPFMSLRLAGMVKKIELCLISPANRAQMTAKEFRKVFSFKEVKIESSIYHASSNQLIEVLHDISDQYSSAIIFGHNPGYTYVHNHFAESIIENLPTCGIFELICNVESWKEVDSNNTDVGILIYPKMFNISNE